MIDAAVYLGLFFGALLLEVGVGLLRDGARLRLLLSWCLRGFSIWMLALIAGAAYPIWIALLSSIVGALIEWRHPGDAAVLFTELLHVAGAWYFSVPSLSIGSLLLLFVLVVLTRWIGWSLGVRWVSRLGRALARSRLRLTLTVVAVLALGFLLIRVSGPSLRASVGAPRMMVEDLGVQSLLTASVSLPLQGERMRLPTGGVAWLDRNGNPSRPGILLLHGADPTGSHRRAADALRRALAETGRTVLAVDYPGYGERPLPDDPSSVEAWDPVPSVREALDLLQEETGTRGFFAVGHSTGSSGVLRLASASPELLAGVLLDAPVREPSGREGYRNARFQRERAMTEEMSPQVFRDLRRSSYDSRRIDEGLPEHHPPIVIARFGTDRVESVDTREDLYRTIPGSKELWDFPRTTYDLSTFDLPGHFYAVDSRSLRSFSNRMAAFLDDFMGRVARQWETVEWTISGADAEGDPFDVQATALLVHESGEARKTEMYYADPGWSFRFTGTRPGLWTLDTFSENPDLDGRSGTVRVAPESGDGFVVGRGSKWGFTGSDRVFVPQYVMYAGPQYFFARPELIREDVRRFISEGGFNGMHVPVFCRWFDLREPSCDGTSEFPTPDPRTFEALEDLIREVHSAGGVVHLWLWGDEQRRMTPKRWGINGVVDRRLQRYIAARLGPIPGWTMGYGFDLWEWVDEDDLESWYSNMKNRMGWPHPLGARGPKNSLDQIYEGMDYAAYEQHRPDYRRYRQTLEARPHMPAFSEDRFRVRSPEHRKPKDYDFESTIRGMWRSTMAGGVGNIWGNLIDARGANLGLEPSNIYPNQQAIRTYSRFFDQRFVPGLEACNHLTDGVCLGAPEQGFFIFYEEDTDRLEISLPDGPGPLSAVAVDTRAAYSERRVDLPSAGSFVWTAPGKSDWAIAVGRPGPASRQTSSNSSGTHGTSTDVR